MPKLFTLEEANALLPELRQVLGELRRAVEELERTEPQVAALRWQARGNGHAVSDGAFTQQEEAREKVNQQISRVRDLGCELKDLRLGLIDFPSLREGDVLYLCWKPDESEVGFWHPLDVGFASRQPL